MNKVAERARANLEMVERGMFGETVEGKEGEEVGE